MFSACSLFRKTQLWSLSSIIFDPVFYRIIYSCLIIKLCFGYFLFKFMYFKTILKFQLSFLSFNFLVYIRYLLFFYRSFCELWCFVTHLFRIKNTRRNKIIIWHVCNIVLLTGCQTWNFSQSEQKIRNMCLNILFKQLFLETF